MRTCNEEYIKTNDGAFCKVVCCGMLCVAFLKGLKYLTKKDALIGNRKYEYSDAVEAILDSSMLSSDKKDAVVMLKRDEDSDYYKAIIYMTKLDVLSGDKLEMIKKLSKK